MANMKRFIYMMGILLILILMMTACSKATPEVELVEPETVHEEDPALETEAIEEVEPAIATEESVEVEPTPELEVSLDLVSFPLWFGVTGNEPDGEGRDYWDHVAEEFMKLHPNVTVNVEMWDWGTYSESRATRLAANNPPDVAYTCDQDLHASPEWFMPLNDYIDEAYWADVPADTWELYTEDGQILGFPSELDWMSLVINADLFRERGVPIPADPDREWTWDEFMDAVQELTFDRDGDGTIDVYGTAVAAIPWDMEWSNFHYLFNRGARFMDPTLTKFTFNDEKGVEALQWLLDLQDIYNVIPFGASGLRMEDASQMLFRGQIAMFHGSPGTINWMDYLIESGELEKPVDLMVVQYPHFPGETMVTDILSACGFSVYKRDDPYRQEMAAQLAKFITSTEGLKNWKAGAYIPARYSSMEGLYDDNPDMAVHLNMAQYTRVFWSHQVDMWTYADHMNAILPSVFNHELTPKEALDRFVAEAQPIFDENYPKP